MKQLNFTIPQDHPLLKPLLVSHCMKNLVKFQSTEWETNLAQLFLLRQVCSLWKQEIDAILGDFDSLSLLPHPSLSLSKKYYMDSLHASLFHLTPGSYLGSPYYYHFFNKGRVINETAFFKFLSHFPKLKYLSIVELNKIVLDTINRHSIQLKGLAFDLLDEATVTQSDLQDCCFNGSLELISFSYFISKRWIISFTSIFKSLKIIHFSCVENSFVVPFEVLYSTGPNLKAVYLGNRMVTFDNTNMNMTNLKTDFNELTSLEILTPMTLYNHQHEFLLNQLNSFKFLKNLHLDVSNIQKVNLLKLIGKITSVTTLKLILPSGKDLSLAPFPLQEIINNGLEHLILIGNIEFPIVKDVQISKLEQSCSKLKYLCVNALIYTVKNANEYMNFLRSLSYLDHLHIGYRPLLESIENVRVDLIQLSHSFVTFRLIYWCNAESCQCLQKDHFTVHRHYCNCSYYVSKKSMILWEG